MRGLELPELDPLTPEVRRRALKARRRFLGVWTAVGAILLAAVVIYLLNVLSAPMGVIIWATIIVFCLRGIVNGLEKRGINRGVGTAIAYVVMFVVLGALFVLMFSPVFGFGNQFANLVESIPGLILPDQFSTMGRIAARFEEHKLTAVMLSMGGWLLLNGLLAALMDRRVQRMDIEFSGKE